MYVSTQAKKILYLMGKYDPLRAPVLEQIFDFLFLYPVSHSKCLKLGVY